ncbi:MAG TPA: hypothetical protein VD997_15805 [Phycisphaerales bacterium]|nr:hypothetical protein [Phycisphaerales bacterium]
MTGDRTTNPTHESPSGIAGALARLRTAAKAQLVIQRVGLLGAAFVGYVILAAFIDYFLRMPMPVRLVLWLGSMAVLGACIWRYLVPAAKFNPTLTDVALRVENSPEGQKAGLSGVLASALELSTSQPHSVLAAELRIMSAEQARRRFSGAISTSALLAKRRLGHALVALVAVGIPMTAIGLTQPRLARIGTERVLTPWTNAAWPKRTSVADANRLAAHPIGTALPLRAVLAKQKDGRSSVTVNYRVITDGKAGVMQRALLTGQNKAAKVEGIGGAQDVEGELFERLLDTASMAPPHAPGTPAPKVELEYTFTSSDDETEPAVVTLVEPPAVLASTVQVTAPAYASAALATQASGPAALFQGQKDTGPGRDERAAVGPILAGSQVTLTLTLNKPLPVPADSAEQAQWLKTVTPGLEQAEGLATRFDATTWTISFTPSRSLRVPFVLVDEYGIASSDDAAFRFDVAEDRPPAAAVIEPQQDESILPTALIETAGEGRDDVGLSGVSLRSQIAKPPAGSLGAPPEPQGEPTDLATAVPAEGTVSTLLRAGGPLDVSSLEVVPGDEVWLTAQVSDIFALNGANHAPVVSTRRRLRIIGETDLIEQFRSELAGVREAAKRLDQDQERLALQRQDAAADSQKAGEQGQKQKAITDRMKPLEDAVQRLSDRAGRNRLQDKSLQELLNDAASLIDQATENSEQAENALDKLSGNTPSDNKPQDQQQLEQSQENVQESLQQLANMLDRGQDSWAMKRSIEKLLTEQQQLSNQTANADPSMKGQDAEQLNAKQREELDRLAQKQQELAQRAAALTDQLQQRAEQMKEVDPAQAQSLENAANKARQQQIDQKQQQAAESLQQNKTDEAQEQQQQAEQALKSMLDELDRAEQQRDQALRRVLADLLQSLEKLIKQQDGELARLGAVMGNNAQDATLDQGMIALNQNTLGVLATVKKMREAADVAEYIDAAAGAQSAAVVSLRGNDQPEADANERISLARLKDAREAAQKLEDDAAEREAERKKDELRKQYTETLELQVALRAETMPLIGKELDRRDRQTARALAQRQEEIRVRLSELRSSTQEMEEAKVFAYAHARLDALAAGVAKTLSEGAAPDTVTRDQTSIIRILQGLIEAVNEMARKNDDFREENQGGDDSGGGGGGGEQPLIPPVAELKLLRFMQIEAAGLTRAAAEKGDAETVETVTRLQRELADEGKALLERLKQEEGPTPDAPEKPNQDPKPEPHQ